MRLGNMEAKLSFTSAINTVNTSSFNPILTSWQDSAHWSGFEPVAYSWHVALGIFMIPVTFMAVLGNGLVVWIFVRFRSLRTPANILVINLALSDFLMASTGYSMFIIASFHGQWTFGKAACEFYGMTGAWFALMSINSMVAIAIDRYLIIYKSYKITYRQCFIWLIIIWLYSLLWALPPLFGWSRYTTEAFGTTCSYDYLISGREDKYFLMCVVVGDFVLPLFIICYCYTWILLKFRAHQQKYGLLLRASRSSQSDNRRQSSDDVHTTDAEKSELMKASKPRITEKFKSTEFKIAKTVVFVVLAFCISWTPYAVVCLIGQYGNKALISPTVAMVPVIVAKLGAIYNPFIYALTHPRFKQALRKILPCCVHVGRAPIKRSHHQAFKTRVRYKNAPSGAQENNMPQYVISLRSPRDCSNKLPADVNLDVAHVGKLTGSDQSSSKGDVSMEAKQGSNTTPRIVALRNLEENVTLKGCTDANDFLVKWLCEAAKSTPDGRVVLCLKDFDNSPESDHP